MRFNMSDKVILSSETCHGLGVFLPHEVGGALAVIRNYVLSVAAPPPQSNKREGHLSLETCHGLSSHQ